MLVGDLGPLLPAEHLRLVDIFRFVYADFPLQFTYFQFLETQIVFI